MTTHEAVNKMMKPDDDERLDNPILYRFIEMAYEYARQWGQPLDGDRLGVLRRLWARRLEYVHGLSQGALDDWVYGNEQLTELLDSNSNDEELVGTINDFQIRHDGQPFRSQRAVHDQWYEAEREAQREIGLEAHATYRPIHFFFDDSRRFDTDWGIYISERAVLGLAARFADALEYKFGPPKDGVGFVDLAYQVLLRHEIMHFKVESFALNAEMATGRPLYTPYLSEVYATSYPSNDCLEEALANATVLRSTKIHNLVKQRLYPDSKEAVDWKGGVIEYFSEQPEAYRNYGLHEGPHDTGYHSPFSLHQRATNYLCNQIVTGERYPAERIPFYAFPPDNYFLRAETLVPIHIVNRLDEEESFIQVATPKKTRWEAFLRDVGCWKMAGGSGDHSKWGCPNGHSLTIDYKKNELDLGSFKSSLRTLGLKMSDYQTYRQTGRLPNRVRHLTR